MSETKHVTGPWKVVDRSQFNMRANDPKWEIDDAAGKQHYWIALAINEADARLIAAAPTMHGYIKKRSLAGDLEARTILEQIDANS